MNDIAKFDEIFKRVSTEQVYYVSFLRSLSAVTITGQFRRMANGGAALSGFSFTYSYTYPKRVGNSLVLDFSVVPESFPPTNVHVIIGRNASGKTFLINHLMDAVLTGEGTVATGSFEFAANEGEFANVISVSFSAFDDIDSKPEDIDLIRGIKYTYVGLKKTDGDLNDGPVFKTPDDLADEFVSNLYFIRSRSLSKRWIDSVKSLYSDPNFEALEIHSLMEIADDINAKALMYD
ncbi:MAG: ATP-binding protein, partial [Chitinophagaceae bacterium]